MNDTVANLYKQSVEQSYDFSTQSEINVPKEMKKFAELIVFECIKLAVFKGDSATGKAIKEHFGVKE